MKTKLYLGIDVAKNSFDVAVANEQSRTEDWASLPHWSFSIAHDDPEARARICEWLESRGLEPDAVQLVVMESTGPFSRRMAKSLSPWSAAIVNPNQVKYYAGSLGHRGKSDRVDAAVIALYAARRNPAPVPVRSECEEKLRQFTRLRQQYSEDLATWKTRLEQADLTDLRKEIKATITQIEKRIARLDLKIEKTMEEDEQLAFQTKSIQAITGIKKVVAPVLTSELGDLRKYARNQLVACGGLNPIPNESGPWKGKSRMAKGGGSRIRRVLHMAARSLFRSKGPLRNHIEHLKARGLSKACITGIMMRKLLLLARAVMCNNGVYDPALISYQGAQKRS